MQTKIVLTGTFSTGKTTLLQFFDNEAYIIPEIARDILKLQPELQKEPEFQQLILREQLHQEELAERSNYPLIVCDRGVIDVIAYCRYFGHPEPGVSFHYDHIFLCSPSGVPSVYGDPAEEMRQDIHKIFLNVLTEQKLPFITLEGTAEERYMAIQKELDLAGLVEGNARPWQERK